MSGIEVRVRRRYIILGPQGSGKGTQARLLAERLGIVAISTGELLRGQQSKRSELGTQIEQHLSNGDLVPDVIVESVLQDRIERLGSDEGFILDGFPRTRSQAEFFLQHFEIDAVILLEVDDGVVIGRALNRRLCASCGADYNMANNPPLVEGICDSCGGPVVSREDDTDPAIRHRLSQYRRRSERIVGVLEQQVPIIRIDASGSIEEGHSQIMAALGAEGA